MTPSPEIQAPRSVNAFTLIELLVVIAIIAILAGLVLRTAGYVQQKGAMSRAETEIAAISVALESYKADYGDYPTNGLGGYTGSALLYQALIVSNATLNPLNKIYLELPKSAIVSSQIIDPFGSPYFYKTGAEATNNGSNFFDLWSTAGSASNTNKWIKNW